MTSKYCERDSKACGASFTFTFMHLADAFIQSDLHCIQITVLHFYQLLLSLGIEPMILALLAPCSTIWATGKLQRHTTIVLRAQCRCIRWRHIRFKPARESKTMVKREKIESKTMAEGEDQTSSRILSAPSRFESQVWKHFGFYTLPGKHD